MIRLKEKQEILIMHLREGGSQREIARITGVDRKTVRKYIKEYEARRKELESTEDPIEAEELIQAIVETPKYKKRAKVTRVMTEEVERKIRQHLEENNQKCQNGMRKQVKKAIDIFQSLVDEGIDISYSTVRRKIREIEKKPKEAYIKGSYLPGDVCEFDWGEVKIYIKGKLRTLQMAVFTSAYGNYRMAYLFNKQKTECFQEAHALFFEQVGGVYQTLVYDNMKVAVKRFVGTEKEPTEALLKLSLYYNFQYQFCNVRRGNEKGHVERSVEVVRRKAFAYRHTFETLEEANQYLLEICIKLNNKPQEAKENLTAETLLYEEQKHFLPLLPKFDSGRLQSARVDKYSTIVIDQNHYSVPDHLVGEMVKVKIYPSRIRVYMQEELAAEHTRLTGNHEWTLNLDHYLNTLKKKPGALAGSTALQQADNRIKNIYYTYYNNKDKEFIELLQYIKNESSLEEIESSVKELCKIHPSHVTTDKIKILCAKNRESFSPSPKVTEDTKDIMAYAKENLKLYDELFQTQTVGLGEDIA